MAEINLITLDAAMQVFLHYVNKNLANKIKFRLLERI